MLLDLGQMPSVQGTIETQMLKRRKLGEDAAEAHVHADVPGQAEAAKAGTAPAEHFF